MPTYARREGGAYARGGTGLACRCAGLFGGGLWRQGDYGAAALEIVADRDLQAHRAVDRAAAQRARERGLVLRRLELDQAGHAARAAVVDQLERMHRTKGLAHRENPPGERVEVARVGCLVHD